MARKLASIQRITDLQPIEGADLIEVASVLGWRVVVKKGEFQVGDLAVYMEIDSVPPDLPEYAFLWKNAEQRPNNFRIKTIRLRGQISQGILFPMHGVRFPGVKCPPSSYVYLTDTFYEGVDVTDYLNITKYEAPLPAGSADIEGQFFDGVPKTDEERVQSEIGQARLAALQGRPYYITVKCDGSSMTVAMHDGEAKVASRNYRLKKMDSSAYHRAAVAGGLYNFVERNPHLAVQGELVGPGIQNNRLGLKEHRCLIFNIYDRNNGRQLCVDEMALVGYGLDFVPICDEGNEFDYTQEQLLQLAEGFYEGTTNHREGIVIRSNDDGERISFKAINNAFLLSGGE